MSNILNGIRIEQPNSGIINLNVKAVNDFKNESESNLSNLLSDIDNSKSQLKMDGKHNNDQIELPFKNLVCLINNNDDKNRHDSKFDESSDES